MWYQVMVPPEYQPFLEEEDVTSWRFGEPIIRRVGLATIPVMREGTSIAPTVQIGHPGGARARIISDWHLMSDNDFSNGYSTKVLLQLEKLPRAVTRLRQLEDQLSELKRVNVGTWGRANFVRLRPPLLNLTSTYTTLMCAGVTATEVWVLEYGSRDATRGKITDLTQGHECVCVGAYPSVWIGRGNMSCPFVVQSIMVFRPRPRYVPGQFNMGRSRIRVQHASP